MNAWHSRTIIAIAISLCAGVLPVDPAGADSTARCRIEGLWRGCLQVPQGEKPEMVFRIGRNVEGVLCAYVTSPDQVKRVLVDKVICNGSAVRLDLKGIGSYYEGTLSEQGTALQGKWNQAGMALDLSLAAIDALPACNRPQEPTGRCPYEEESVVFENRSAGVKLAGTLTRPHGAVPCPAVLLLHGSGPNDRDHVAAGHRVFLVLADYLTRRGIAVLRFDKRGVWQSTGNFANATGEDFAADARAGVAYLKSRADIDPDQIGLVGISEGGMVGPLVAAHSPDIAFLVILAGPGIGLDETLTLQRVRYAEAEGAEPEKIALLRRWYPIYYGTGRTEKNDQAAADKIRNAYHEQLNEDDRRRLGWSEPKLEGKIQEVLSPWWRWALAYDPAATLGQVRCPVLALNGQKDRQVTASENLPGLEAALRAGGNPDYTVRELPGLNHLFQTAATGAEAEYAQIAETMSPLALKTIGDWIVAHTRRGTIKAQTIPGTVPQPPMARLTRLRARQQNLTIRR